MDWLAESLAVLSGAIEGAVTGIVDGISDLLKFLFIPTTNPLEEVFDKINRLFPVIEQLKTLMFNLFDYTSSGEPKFEVEIYGSKVSIVDFSIFVEYRVFIHSIIISIAYYNYIRKLLYLLPRFIGGF